MQCGHLEASKLHQPEHRCEPAADSTVDRLILFLSVNYQLTINQHE